MIVVGLPCDFCNAPTINHCQQSPCTWSRCPRCMSYGPSGRMIRWAASDYVNPYNLLDVKTAIPERTFPSWLEETYGVQRNTPEETP